MITSIKVMKVAELNSVILSAKADTFSYNIDFSIDEVNEYGLLKCIENAGKKVSAVIDSKPESMDAYFMQKELNVLREAYVHVKRHANK